MGILAWIVLGLIAGVLAKIILPGRDPGGWIITILLGIGGAFLGAYIGGLLGFGGLTGFSLQSLGIATGGALLILIIYRAIAR